MRIKNATTIVTIYVTISRLQVISESAVESGYGYPFSRFKMMRGKQTVVINIPAHLRHLYGVLRSIRRTTGTSDPKVAQAKHHYIAQQIYDEFDQKQSEHLNKHHAVADNFVIDAIYGLATSLITRTSLT